MSFNDKRLYKRPDIHIKCVIDTVVDSDDKKRERLIIDIADMLTGPTSVSTAERIANHLVGDSRLKPIRDEYAREVALAMREAANRFLGTEEK